MQPFFGRFTRLLFLALLQWCGLTLPIQAQTYRYASTSRIIYVTGPGVTTLSQIKAALPSAALSLVDPATATWHLRASLRLEQGARLNLHGPSIGGDVGELRLQSNNISTTNGLAFIRAEWGTIDIKSTKVLSWDDAVNGPDTNYTAFGRAYIQVRSKLEGTIARESRMDIDNSDISYLGSLASEAYGLSWKVLLPSGSSQFDLCNVYGDITNNHIHHCYYGFYSWGGQDMRITGNEVNDNVGYGIDPHDDSTYLIIADNNVHHNGNHGIIASKWCHHIQVTGNRSYANKNCGIMLHRLSDDGLIENNIAENNVDAGIAIFGTNRTSIRENVCLNNRYGIRFSVGSADNVVENNEFRGSTEVGVYFYQGSDAPNAGDDGKPKRNKIANNLIASSVPFVIKATDSVGNIIENNQITGSSLKFRFDRGTNNVFAGNQIPASSVLQSVGTSASPGLAIVRNQPRLGVTVDTFSRVRFESVDGSIFDPEESNLATTASNPSSLLLLDFAQTGGSSVVTMPGLKASVASGTALVNPASWSTSDAGSRQWTFSIGSSNVACSFEVANLAPGAAYSVRKGNVVLGTTNANSSGVISFVDTSTAGTSTLTVQRQL